MSWTRGSDDHVIAGCGAPGYFGPLLGRCEITSQSVMASFDPVTQTGGTWCSAPSNSDLSCVVPGLRNGVEYAFRFATTVGPAATNTIEVFTPGFNNFVSPNTVSTAMPCCDIPPAPVDVTIRPAGSGVDVSWVAPSTWGGARELTYRATVQGAANGCETTGLACRLDEVPRGKEFRVEVTSSNAAGVGAPALSTPTTLPVVPPAPPAITRTRYMRNGSASIAWAPTLDNGGAAVTEYTALATPGSKRCSTKASARSCTITGLTPGRAYTFTVTATNAAGAGKVSTPSAAGVLRIPASAPRNPASSMTSGSTARVSWTAPSSTGGGRILSYSVSGGRGGPGCSTKGTSCNVSDLAPGRTYSFAITALTTAGTGRPATTTLTVPVPQATPPKPSQALS